LPAIVEMSAPAPRPHKVFPNETAPAARLCFSSCLVDRGLDPLQRPVDHVDAVYLLVHKTPPLGGCPLLGYDQVVLALHHADLAVERRYLLKRLEQKRLGEARLSRRNALDAITSAAEGRPT
jgi:hypothetical protein